MKKVGKTLEIREEILIFYIEISNSVYRFFLVGVGFHQAVYSSHTDLHLKKPFEDENN